MAVAMFVLVMNDADNALHSVLFTTHCRLGGSTAAREEGEGGGRIDRPWPSIPPGSEAFPRCLRVGTFGRCQHRPPASVR
jgi:hypothetical protein